MSGKLMSEKYPAAAAYYEAEMGFEEIGRRMGIPKQTAYFLFVRAINKLRARPEMIRRFAELVELRRSLQDRRMIVEDEGGED